jgi:phosphate transport system substrate-binding protein
MRLQAEMPLAVFAGLAMAASVQAAEITGAGSTFVFPILLKWSADYSAKTGDKVSYQSIGSVGGIVQIKAATVDFGASDAPLAPDELRTLGMGQFPLVIGGIVPVVNLKGVQPGEMRFTGPSLADIYLGKIKTWGDPAIARLNPDLKLPDVPMRQSSLQSVILRTRTVRAVAS